MDYTLVTEHLAKAEHHVARGERHIAEQTALIDRLRHQGHDNRSAVGLLLRYRESQSMHLLHRDRLLKELYRSAGRPL